MHDYFPEERQREKELNVLYRNPFKLKLLRIRIKLTHQILYAIFLEMIISHEIYSRMILLLILQFTTVSEINPFISEL